MGDERHEGCMRRAGPETEVLKAHRKYRVFMLNGTQGCSDSPHRRHGLLTGVWCRGEGDGGRGSQGNKSSCFSPCYTHMSLAMEELRDMDLGDRS